MAGSATEIPVRQHLMIQHAFQRHVDNAVSKTINLAADAEPERVAEAIELGWRLGLKGSTTYRCGSRPDQVLTLGVDEDPTGREFFAKCGPGAPAVGRGRLGSLLTWATISRQGTEHGPLAGRGRARDRRPGGFGSSGRDPGRPARRFG